MAKKTDQFIWMIQRAWSHVTNASVSLSASVGMWLIQRVLFYSNTLRFLTTQCRQGTSLGTNMNTDRTPLNWSVTINGFAPPTHTHTHPFLHAFYSFASASNASCNQPISPPLFCSAQQDITGSRLSHLVTKEQRLSSRGSPVDFITIIRGMRQRAHYWAPVHELLLVQRISPRSHLPLLGAQSPTGTLLAHTAAKQCSTFENGWIPSTHWIRHLAHAMCNNTGRGCVCAWGGEGVIKWIQIGVRWGWPKGKLGSNACEGSSTWILILDTNYWKLFDMQF